MNHKELKHGEFVAKVPSKMFEEMRVVAVERAALEEIIKAQQDVLMEHAKKINDMQRAFWLEADKLFELCLDKHRYTYNNETGEILYDGTMTQLTIRG